ncbi:MAG: DNA recombination protein RmuC [Rhodospirillales bacterium]|nr:DNA recombination protein RmuC [Rhodospirillales bacterium]
MGLGLTIIVIVLAALASAAVCYFAFVLPSTRRAAKEREARATEIARLAAAAERVPGLEEESATLRAQLQDIDRKKAALEAELEAERKSHEARVQELTRMGAELEKKFSGLASDVLGKNSESFLKLVSERFEKHSESAKNDLEKRRVAIETLVKPLGESLSKFEHKVDAIEKARTGAYEKITEQVKSLAEGQTGLRSETSRLVQALRRPETRGRWGEYQLRNVLEMAGMTKHVDFVEQPTITGAEGRLRPDVIIHVPGGTSIVVDAKTPLDAYLSAVDAPDEESRERLLTDHARQMREHVRALASREYSKALPETPDFVVMFVPGESFFAAAIESDPDLLEKAWRDKVLISTPTTLIALVKMIAFGWQQEKLAENAQEVAAQGRDLYERIGTFGRHLGALGKSLRQTVEHYNRGVGSLESRVLPAARRFESLGVAPASSSIPTLEPVELDPREAQAEELAEPPAEEAAE